MKRLLLIIISVFFRGGGILFLNGGCEPETENKTGNITFWTDVDIRGGDIEVKISLQAKTITSIITGFYRNATWVSCDAEYTARFSDLPYGTYYYTASNGYFNWSDSIILKQECNSIRLNGSNAIDR